MSYVVLARKWRPMSFADLIGQEHVCRTLSNAIATNRVAHAFLFTGVRGVGKTTSARIVAKALNCLGDPDLPSVSEGPPPEPCLKCAACTEIAAGIDLDVREIDAASYNGVEEVRKLQDSLPYRPTRDRYKIFIVDEVHMLSQSAWNAFLKTLEEPPAHVKFIFATTEVHKVPVTILSRVQRFDFKLISPAQIGERLRYVLEQEKIETDDASISIIARQAAGSMRDAMSLLDQVIAYDSQRLRADEVARLLGVASHEVLHRLAKHVLDGETVEALRLIAELAVQGFDIPIVCRDLLEAFRDCVIARVTPATAGSILELGVEHHKWLSEQTKQHTVDDLLRVHRGFSASYDEVVRSSQPRTALEMLLVRLSRRPPLIPIDDLIQRLEALEQRTRGKPPDAPGGTRSSSSSSGQGRRGTTREASAGPREQPPRSQAEPAWPAAAQASSAQALAVTGPGSAQPEADTTGAGASSGAPSRNSSRTTPGIMPVSIDNKPSPPRPPAAMLGHAPLMAELGGSSQPAATSLVAPFLPLAIGAAAALAPSVGVELRRSLDDLEQDTPVDKHVADAHACWRSIIATLQGRHPEVAAFFSHGHPVRLDATSIVLAFERGSVLATTAQRTENVNALAEAASSHLGQLPNISFSVLEDDQHETLAQQNKRERIQLEQKLKLEARSHPAVKQVEQLLGARVVEIRLPRH